MNVLNRLDRTMLTADSSPIRAIGDTTDLAAHYRREGWVQIPSFLTDAAAAALHRSLQKREDWNLVLNSGGKIFEIDRAGQAAMTSEQTQALDQAVSAAARRDFQYRYETIRVSDDAADRIRQDTLLDRFATTLCEESLFDSLRTLTGARDIEFADAQATAYSPGHFLTRHDDAVAGKARRAAYVLGLCPEWRAEWGGLLMFHRADGHVAPALVPGFNILTLFSVPQVHSVSLVTPFAASRRYSVTGWLRANAER